MAKSSIIGNVDLSLVSKDASVIVPVRKVGAKVGRDFTRESMECV